MPKKTSSQKSLCWVLSRFVFSAALIKLIGCGYEQNPASKNYFLESDTKNTQGRDNMKPELPSQLGLVKVEIKLDPSDPQNERFRNDWRVGAYNIDDKGRASGPTWFGSTDESGKADVQVPKEMLEKPMVVFAENQAHPTAPRKTLRAGKSIVLSSFIPANCHLARQPIDQLTDAGWRYYYKLAARRGAENWNPSQVDCFLWAKYGLAFQRTTEIQDVLDEVSESETMLISLSDLIPAFQRYPQFSYKTRPPLCFAERRHNGGGLDKGVSISTNDDLNDDEERFIHKFLDENYAGDETSYFRDTALEDRRTASTATLSESGLLRTLCGDGDENENIATNQAMFFRTKLIVNDEDLNSPDEMYDFADSEFSGHVAVYKDPGVLDKLDVESFSIRHNNGFEYDHDKYSEVCSATLMTKFTNKDDREQDIDGGSGYIFTDLFDQAGADLDENFELGANGNPSTDATVWFTSSGNRAIESQDRWAILFDSDPVGVLGGLLGECDPNLFCGAPIVEFISEILSALFPKFDLRQFFKVFPNFPPRIINEAIVVELLGHRKEDFRDVLKMDFDETSEDLFIGLRADWELNEEASDGEEANFMTTITYINKKNVTKTLSLCYEAADYLTRQQIDTLLIKKDTPVLIAAGIIARSRCFSNSRSNQKWQNYKTGLWTLNGHKGVSPNLIIPSGWLAPEISYEVYLKKFDEAVFVGPVTTFDPEPFGGMVLEIPMVTEGDELMFVADDSCCDTFKVNVPCAAEFTEIYPGPGEKMLIDTTGLSNEFLGLPSPK